MEARVRIVTGPLTEYRPNSPRPADKSRGDKHDVPHPRSTRGDVPINTRHAIMESFQSTLQLCLLHDSASPLLSPRDSITMATVVVLYPAGEMDQDYYINKHVPMVAESVFTPPPFLE
jgi:hypothetical protein